MSNVDYLVASKTLVETLNEILGSSTNVDHLIKAAYPIFPTFMIREENSKCCGGATLRLIYTGIKDNSHAYSIPVVSCKASIPKEDGDKAYLVLTKLFYLNLINFFCNVEKLRNNGYDFQKIK